MNSSDVELIQANARHLPLEDESVQCIVTSPPYWGLRKYAGDQESVWGGENGHAHAWGGQIPPRGKSNWNTFFKDDGESQMKSDESLHESQPTSHGAHCRCGAWRGAYGLEPTIEMYVSHTVGILREMRRVLRADGVLFWNIGDSYNSSPNQRKSGDGDCLGYKQATNIGSRTVGSRSAPNLKPKDLCLIPARVAIAAQQDGWWIRSLIIWAKPNPMPESCTDRPTDAYEHIIMLTKSERYFWDADAVREPAATGWNGSSFTDERDTAVYANLGRGPRNTEGYKPGHDARDGKERFCSGTGGYIPPGGRNIRNVWTFPTQPFSGAHFATFPEEIPRRCILAATSARGACTQCGAPWERVIRRNAYRDGSWFEGIPEDAPRPKMGTGTEFYEGYDPPKTIGWRPTCECRGQHGKTRPCLVLDPFAGSGTTGRVARALRRHAVLADLAYGENDEYRKLAVARICNVDVELPFLD
jgi:DNA modification methylase